MRKSKFEQIQIHRHRRWGVIETQLVTPCLPGALMETAKHQQLPLAENHPVSTATWWATSRPGWLNQAQYYQTTPTTVWHEWHASKESAMKLACRWGLYQVRLALRSTDSAKESNLFSGTLPPSKHNFLSSPLVNCDVCLQDPSHVLDVLPGVCGQMQHPKVLVVVELFSIGGRKLSTKHPELTTALRNNHGLRTKRETEEQYLDLQY